MKTQSPSLLASFCRLLLANITKLKNKPARSLVLLGLIAVATTGLASTASSAASLRQLILGLGLSHASGSAPQPKAALTSPLLTAPMPQLSSTMTVERRAHSATQLADGRVLIVGGENGGGLISQSEIFDPTAGTFSVGGNLSDPRADHSAIRLVDGRVLITGGRGTAGALNTTEIFDPTTGAFASGPAMGVARAGHSATLLADGRVLIAGGDANGSAEIFDPSTGNFSAVAANMNVARSMHSAALLQDDRVLIVGGRTTAGDALSSGEIFDPSNSTFADAGSTKDTHVRAVLRVLPDGKVQIIGGDVDHNAIEIYDPAAAIFGAHAHDIDPANDEHAGLIAELMSSPSRAALIHNGQTITELPGSNKALGAGGTDSSGNATSAATIYDSSPASVTTDVLDYPPGTPVIITGRGFQPNELVDLTFHEDPHTHAENVRTVQADTSGTFTYDQYAPEEHDLGVAYILGAKGQASGLTAQTTFTDAVRNWTLTFGGTGNGSVTIGVSSGTINAPTSCGGTGTAVASQTVTSTCSPNITTSDSNATVTFSASATGGSTFTGWSGQAGLSSSTCAGTTNPCSAVFGGGATLTVTFNAANVAPVASAVSISGTAEYGQLLTGNYTYNDADGDLQGTSTFRWLRNGTTVVGTNQTYTAVGADVGQTLTFEVTPVAASGISPGTAVQSSAVAIGKAPLTVTASSHTLTYGDPIPTVTPSYATFVSGDNAAGIDTPPTCTTTYTTTSVAGSSQTTTCSGGSDNNYSFSFVAGTVTINKADATVVVTPYSVPYDGNAHTATYTITGVNGETGATVGTVDVSNTTHTNAGTYASDSWSFTGAANYNNIAATTISDTINKATPTATLAVNNSPQTYDGSAKSATVAISASSVPGAVANILTGGAATQTNANTYAVTADFVPTDTANYNTLTGLSAGNFVIDKATPTVNASGNTCTYNGTPCVGSGSATGGAGESLTVTLSYTGTGATTYGPSATAPSNAGSYQVVAHTDGDGNNNSGDSAPAAVTINKANPTVSATGGTFTYNGTPQGGSGTATGGAGESLTVTLSYTGTGATTYGPSATAPTNAGSYQVVAHTDGDGNNNSGDSAPAAVTISKRNTLTTISSSLNPSTFGASVSFSATVVGTGAGAGDPSGGTVQFKIDGSNFGPAMALVAGSANSGSTTTLSAGNHIVEAIFTSTDANFNGSSDLLDGGQVVNKRNTLTTVSSSQNPSIFGTSVFFTATVVGAGAGAGNPSGGSVQFKIDSVNFGAPVALVAGSASSSSTTTLSVGNHIVEAIFTSTDTNFNGSADLLDGGQTVGAWTLTGFYQPVGIPNTYGVLIPPMAGITWNSIKGGQTVPLKFNVFAGTVEQTLLSAIAGFTVQEVTCVNVETWIDDVDFVTTGSTQLRYDGTPGSGGQFIQNWQTPKTFNKCYRTVMQTTDGSVLVSFFVTKK